VNEKKIGVVPYVQTVEYLRYRGYETNLKTRRQWQGRSASFSKYYFQMFVYSNSNLFLAKLFIFTGYVKSSVRATNTSLPYDLNEVLYQ